MNLSDLQFTPEDVFAIWQKAQLKVIPGESDTIDELTKGLNYLLFKRLSKAELVFNTFTTFEDGTCSQSFQWDVGVNAKHTHFARLIGIEPLIKD